MSETSFTLRDRVQAARAGSSKVNPFALLKDLETALDDRDRQFNALQKNYENLHSICEEYHNELETLREKQHTSQDNALNASKLENENNASRKEIASLKAQRDSIEEETRQLKEQLEATRSKLSTYAIQVDELVVANKRISSNMRDADKRYNLVEKRAAELEKCLETERCASAAVSVEKERLRLEREKLVLELDTERKLCQSTKSELKDLLESRAEEQSAHEKITDYAHQVHQLTRINSQLDEEVRKREEECSQLKEKIQTQMHEHEATLEGLRERTISDFRHEAANMSRELEARDKLIHEVKNQLEAEKRRHQATCEALRENDTSAQRSKELEIQASELEAQVSELKDKLTDRDTHNADLHRRLSASEAVHDELLQKADAAAKAAQDAVAKARSSTVSDRSSSMVYSDVSSMRKELEGWTIVARDAKEAKERLASDLAASRREVAALRMRLAVANPERRNDPENDTQLKRESQKSERTIISGALSDANAQRDVASLSKLPGKSSYLSRRPSVP